MKYEVPGRDIYKEPYEGYTHRPHFLKQEEITQFAVKNSCPELTWNLYGFPMPQIRFTFEGKDIELGEKFTCNYRSGIHSVWKITVWSITVNGLKYLRFWGK